ncbi:hypothetical protein [Microbacterium radiodurans]|uniref:DUF4175 domain-containing protein n=1 Tax=Microbacterium radiodurans TaxID=661398 RepID=A0A5J5ISK6_9MICO|nr:hypothetical protein [Microbacterium radiodurans]KAA9086613.1 hypothetical protein F6B42_06240 [Microbacterium radiodurans]
MTRTQPPSQPIARIRFVALSAAVVGAVLVLTALVLDWAGFWGGFALGSGIAMVVVAAYLLGLVTGMRRGAATPAWRPASAPSESAA